MNSPVWFSTKCTVFALALVGLALLAVADDIAVAKSYVLGGLIYAVPNLYFVHYAFRFRGAQNVALVLRSFSWGESGKFALAALGFVLAFRYVEFLHHAALFAGFIATMVLQWFIAAALVKRRDISDKTN